MPSLRSLLWTPLVALLSVCSPDTVYISECVKHNQTTTPLNHVVDGTIARITELEALPENGIISPALIDLVNETHALAVEGMPPDVRMTLTPEDCFLRDDEAIAAYAVPEAINHSDRGIYFPRPITVVDFFHVSHEIGHLQAGGNNNEVMGTLNDLEQRLMGYVVFANQHDHPQDIIKWGSYAFFKFFSMLPSPNSLPEEVILEKHEKAKVYVLRALAEENGDFEQVRAKVMLLQQEGQLDAAVDEAVETFRQQGRPASDYFLNTSILSYLRLYQYFGNDVAQTYFQANERNNGNGLTYGLEGLNCALASFYTTSLPKIAIPVCNAIEAPDHRYLTVDLCCFDLDTAGLPAQRWKVEASGIACGTGTQRDLPALETDGIGWERVTYITDAQKTLVGEGEYCR